MEHIYGDFLENNSDFCITTPDIPRNWYNYLWNDRYMTVTSQTGAGESFLQDNLGRRIDLVKERGFVLMEGDIAWGIHGLPVREKREGYRCIHRRGETELQTINHGIVTTIRTIVPVDGNCELWSVTLKNDSDSTRNLRLVGFCGTGFDSKTYVRQAYDLNVANFEPAYNAIVSKKNINFDGRKKQPTYAYMALSDQADAFDCTLNAIVGPYGSFAHPVVAERGGCSNSPCCGEKMAFALEKHFTLAAGESKSVVFACGIAFSQEQLESDIQTYANVDAFDLQKEAALCKFAEQTDAVSIQTPDEKLNKMFDWLKHQSNLGSRWARVRHNGFRDMTSDTDCLAAINPELALERFLRILSYQYSTGYAPRTFIDGAVKDNNFSDNTVWLNFTAASIVKELGRLDVLDMEVPYNDGTVGTVYEHLWRSVDFLYHFRGLHDLIKIWGGDWNDCMNTAGLGGRGVSVWLSIAWYRANNTFAELAELYGRHEDVQTARERGEEMRELIEQYGWDGEYYLTAYNDADQKIGSHECREGRIFLIPQLWAVLSGVSKNGREKIAMDAVEKYLSTPLGTVVSAPAYTEYDSSIGSVTSKPAGIHENGGVYLHTIAWKLAADAMLGRADWVEQDIETILPFRNKIVNGRAEPYVMCNSYFGIQTGYRYGTPGQSWRTAAGQWFQKALVNYVFGLYPEMEGLRVQPCLPPSWKVCSVTKRFRNTTYRITYQNHGTAVKEILVDGKTLEGRILPLTGGTVEVCVITE